MYYMFLLLYPRNHAIYKPKRCRTKSVEYESKKYLNQLKSSSGEDETKQTTDYIELWILSIFIKNKDFIFSIISNFAVVI